MKEVKLNILKRLLQESIDNIDAGNSNITEEEALKLTKVLQSYTDKTVKMSKYQACMYLHISRATFDNYVRDGKLPKGKHDIGFKELSWSQKDLDRFMKLK